MTAFNSETDQALGRLDELIRGSEHEKGGWESLGRRETKVWFIRTLNFLRGLLGRDNLYRREIEGLWEHRGGYVDFVEELEAINLLKGLREDVAEGHLTPFETLVSAHLANDLMDQSGYLFEKGYVVASASVAGAVLEEGLRQLAKSRDLRIPQKSSIAELNKLLARAGAISEVDSKRVSFWNSVRNKADHLEMRNLKSKDVETMISEVRTFLLTALT